MTKGVEDGMGDACDRTNDSELCGLRGNWCYIHHCYPATCEKLGLGIHAKPAVPVANVEMKDEVESATSKEMLEVIREYRNGNHHGYRNSSGISDENCSLCVRADKLLAPPSPTLKDEVYAMLAELNMPGQLCGETVRILTPYLEDAVKWRKR